MISPPIIGASPPSLEEQIKALRTQIVDRYGRFLQMKKALSIEELALEKLYKEKWALEAQLVPIQKIPPPGRGSRQGKPRPEELDLSPLEGMTPAQIQEMAKLWRLSQGK
jgi:hypothetical protein